MGRSELPILLLQHAVSEREGARSPCRGEGGARRRRLGGLEVGGDAPWIGTESEGSGRGPEWRGVAQRDPRRGRWGIAFFSRAHLKLK